MNVLSRFYYDLFWMYFVFSFDRYIDALRRLKRGVDILLGDNGLLLDR